MAPSTIVFPKQGYVEFNLLKKKTARGTKEKLVPPPKRSQSRLHPPPSAFDFSSPPITTSRKRKRVDNTLGESYQGASTRSHDEFSVGFDGFPSREEDAPETVNPDAFRNPSGTTSTGKTTHDYMKKWVEEKQHLFLTHLLHREALNSPTCVQCSKQQDTPWICYDCLGPGPLCRTCLRDSHIHAPYHRVAKWNGSFFQPSWLWRAGVIICLGHGGVLCPSYGSGAEIQDRCVKFNGLLEGDGFDPDDPTFGAVPSITQLGSGKIVTVAHTNGFHHLPIFPCACPTAPGLDEQYLGMDLYPATSTDIATVFTFALLDHFHLTRVDSHLSAENYCRILQRLTNYVFPDQTPDRRRELMRAWQQWNHLKNLKRYGFGNRTDQGHDPPGNGAFALFCPVCPQPGINLPEDWRSRPPLYLYYRYLVGDGNFVCNHVHVGGTQDSVRLGDGTGYMVPSEEYRKHVQESRETVEPPTCYEHRAVTDKNKTKKGYDSTGIVAVACARHGCFAPCACADMQKGERQLNMDYVVCKACEMTNAENLLGVLFAYDINCQYCVHFRERVSKGQYLSFPASVPIHFLIGLFHVHGHKEECLARYGPTFFPGAGVTSGEILESLWSQLNGAANITRTATLANRSETLDACMSDINWRKLQDMVGFLIRQRKRAVTELGLATQRFDQLDHTASPEQRSSWLAQMNRANNERTGNGNIAAMDMYNLSVETIEPKIAVQVRLMREEGRKNGAQVGVTTWVAEGILLQETQLSIRQLAEAHQRSPTDERALELQKKRAALLKRLNEIFAEASSLFPNLAFDGLLARRVPLRDVCTCEETCTCGAGGPENHRGDGLDVEYSIVPLPSSFQALPPGWEELGRKEEALRVAQADEALESLRGDIGHKSYLYRANRGLATGKRERTRGYDAINSVERSMRLNAQKYRLAQWSLEQLHALERYPQFKPLLREDTKAVTAIFDPNKPGLRTDDLSWIWKMSVKQDSEASNYLQEVYRINWIRSTSVRDRWREELDIVTAEMEWYIRYMLHRKKNATSWTCRPNSNQGQIAYAYRQANMWNSMAIRAANEFFHQAGVSISVE